MATQPPNVSSTARQPLDAITIAHLARELDTMLAGSKINRIQQSCHDDCLIHFWQPATGGHHKFYVNVHPKHAFCCLLESPLPIEIPKTPLQLCVLLRKYLTGARLRHIKALAHERALILDFENTNDIAERTRYAVIIELMGKTSNLLLVDSSVNVILGTAHGVSDDMSRRRSLRIGEPYAPPPKQANRQPIAMARLEDIKRYWNTETDTLDVAAFSKQFSGIGLATLHDLHTIQPESRKLTPDAYYQNLQTALSSDVILPALTESGYSLFAKTATFKSLNSLIAQYYGHAFRDSLIGDRQRDLRKRLKKHHSKISKRLDALALALAEDSDTLKADADQTMIAALSKEPDGSKHSGKLAAAQKQYTQLKKLKLRQKLAREEQALLQQRLGLLDELDFWIQRAQNKDDLRLASDTLQSFDWLNERNVASREKQQKHPLLKFVSPTTGAIIWVGKSALQNDYLLRNTAKADDLWLHIQAGPGGHVLLQSPQAPHQTHQEADIHLAAQLAVYYSPQLEGENVPVVATLAKFVKRVAGGPAGLVQYKNEETYFVTIDEAILAPVIEASHLNESNALAQSDTER